MLTDMTMKVIKYVFSLLLPTVLLASCIDPAQLEVLDESNAYQNIEDANSAVKGLYSKVMVLAEQTVVLNELRADLMDVTSNAGQDLQDISYFNSDEKNEYVNVVPYYSVVQSCNDMLSHFDIMKTNHRFTDAEYEELYSDVMTVRCWTYFQLGTLFGRIPYITKPIISIDSLQVDSASFYTLDQLIPELIGCMEALPTLEQYSTSSDLNTAANGHYLEFYFINKRCLLADLYMWNDQYLEAAQTIRDFHLVYETSTNRYKNFTYVYQGAFVGAYMITYTRYLWNDIVSLVNTWNNLYSLEMEDTYANWEHITCMTFDKNYEPVYPFIRLFGNQGVGKYLLRPSQNVMDNYWGVQVQSNGFQFDGRGLGGSYILDELNRPVITKYTQEYDLSKPYEQAGRWYIYRSSWLNLLYAEACNRYAEQHNGEYMDGDTAKPYIGIRALTLSFLNNGLASTFNFTKPNGTVYPTDSVGISGWGGGNYFPQPFYFDARYSTVPYVRGYWRDNGGIRGRVSLASVNYNASDSTFSQVRFWEKSILDEMALETAFEGHRWQDILRIARRWNRENSGDGTALLNQLIGTKFAKNGKTAPTFANDESNWYLPVKFN
jgi:starch-binding outer membrane protein, SusD/RagB family